jgi:uncharacterized protein YegL
MEFNMPLGLPEFIENPESRCPVILLLDASASMSGQPIQELNRGVAAFKEDLLSDAQASLSVELAIIRFGSSVSLIQDFVTIEDFTPPTLTTDGATPMGKALDIALDTLENRKALYRDNSVPYYRPWVFLITDGAPTDDWQSAAKRLREAEDSRQLLFFAIGVTGADFDFLRQISSPERLPMELFNIEDFRKFFLWLSASMKRVSSGKIGESVELPAVSWGRVTA